ncbi:T9SS type A sorting domain-containing protein [Flexithrix dorotheae]|uniref:T9SS type A sorting domain-containing protein n=1 Tax=Flexithrix dorotheae TaxID=70993 RepID=UPI00039B1C95|nr:T9SS type A sorting domain-containing protein [Flexithrix dorotheae]
MFKLLLVLLFLFQFGGIQSVCGQSKIDVDFRNKWVTNGKSEFDRKVFINIHSSYTGNEWTLEELKDVHENLRVNFGRSVGGVTWQLNRIEEDPERPGFPDINHMKSLGKSDRDFYSTRTSIHPFEVDDFVMTSHISPLYPNGTATQKGWIPEGYPAIAQFYAHYLKEYYGENGGKRPRYLEVLNEPLVHLNQLNTTSENIAKFHNYVADSVRSLNPDVQVGGYTGAWPEFENKDFEKWDSSWKTFIDIAGENMDFLSFHIYDTPKLQNPAFRKGSNAEAILDMVEQYSMLKLGEVKPIIISEYGGCCADWDGPYSEERDWRQMKSISGILMSLMDRPDMMLKAIPFIVDKAVWYSNANPYPYPHVLLREVDGEWVYTHLVKFYQLWQEVEGTRVDTYSYNPDIQVHAYVNGEKAYVILNNLGFEQQEIPVQIFDQENIDITQIKVKHLFARDNIPQLTDVTVENTVHNFEIAPEGTMVIAYTFSEALSFTDEIQQSKYYANDYLKPISANEEISFHINNVQTADLGEAFLRVSVGRDHGKSLHPSIIFNGETIEVPENWKGDDQHGRNRFFGTIEIPVDIKLVNENNVIDIKFEDTNGHISSVTLVVKSSTKEIKREAEQNEVTGMGNDKPADIHIFPNPTSGKLKVDIPQKYLPAEIKIFDIQGRKILNHIRNHQSDTLPSFQLKSGIYFLNLKSANVEFSRKLMVD